MDASLEKRLKRQVIGKPHRFLAVTPLGFEQTLAKELECILAPNENAASKNSEQSETPAGIEMPHVTGDGKVEFTAKITEAWKAVAFSRIANRILMHIADFKAENFRELEKKASEIPWELYLEDRQETRDERISSGNLLHIHVSCKHSRLYHSDAIAERLYSAIKGGRLPLAPVSPSSTKNKRPEPAEGSEPSATPSPRGSTPNTPPQNLYVTLLDDRCTIWLDLAGEELYKRGHERFVNDAPLKETIAAGMIFEAIYGTMREYCLLDLMAGSGTFSLEAAYAENNLIPGICRDFALKHQPAFKEATWNYITNSEFVIRNSKLKKIVTSDISERAIEIIQHNVESSPLANVADATAARAVTPKLRDFFSYSAEDIAEVCGETAPILVLNPPYGKRLDFDAPKLYTRIGRRLAELDRALKPFGKDLTVAIIAPKDDTREGAKYTCTANLLRECPALRPEENDSVKCIRTSHGGLSLNIFIAKI